MIYGYARCSTTEELQDINRQIRELKALGAEKIYKEYASGIKEDREELQELLQVVNEGDTIIALEVSRITRSTKHLCELINFAKEKKLKLVFGNFVVDCTGELDPMTEGMLKMMGVFSEMERNIISQRVKSGMANARANGKVIGRPALTAEDVPKDFLRHYPKYKSKEITKTEFARLIGISRPTLDKYVRLLDGKV
ncbi:recombinase family protein [Clostridium tarantellae]|uniref:Recombinase family protein n=2 Tax=Clostridium tarantellae TaxID=39493 RepID=A0A6I1MYY1_9CLOT|nr:recombinase family protein [Clostridium tarantellae]MPQ45319.1 recombinase family protein [Clostridium tarantellae]